ncbi:MAG: multicopper oxidase domain-containing protein [Cytophagales bacterium]|nr:multicopper oxidase domain-containing protein [Cytophagales bacterium]
MLLTVAAYMPLLAQHNNMHNAESTALGKRVEYDLYIDHLMVNYTGKSRMGMAINEGIPGPVLHFNEGDTAIIRVHNKLKNEETSIHWHGLLLPNEEDGVPYLTTAPIKAGQTHTFKFPLIQTGTYWYHSHTMLQEQSGIYGSIVIHPRGWNESMSMKEHVIMLSDWTDENPHEVLRNLKRGLDYYAIKKKSVQSWGEALAKGYLKDRAKTEWMRMPAMDVSDVYYNRIFINGKSDEVFANVKPGDSLRLRIINGSASTYQWAQYAGGKMKVVAADGIAVLPVEVDKILVAIAETYDVEIKIPDDGMAYEFRATAQDISGYASIYFGNGMKMNAPTLPKLNYFAMLHEMNDMGNMVGMDMPARPSGGSTMKGMKMEGEHQGHDMRNMKTENMDMRTDTTMKEMPMDTSMMEMDTTSMKEMNMPARPSGGNSMNRQDTAMSNMDMSKMEMGSINMGDQSEVTLAYDMLRSPTPTVLNDKLSMREIKLSLTGNMIRYVWSFDNKTLSQSDKIVIRKGENVRMILVNNTMMRHPLHLHGHFFRFLNAQGEYSPLKHTFDIAPMETVTIEFYANEEKDWFFHCHILYHMMAGMARVVSYENSPPNTQLTPKDQQKVYKEDRMLYFWGQTKIATDAVFGFANIVGNRGILGTTYRVSYKNQYEFQPDYQRFLDKRQFLSAYVGADIRNTFQVTENGKQIDRKVGVLGMRYLLPMFVQSELRVDHRGNVRFQLSRNDMPITRRLRLSLVGNSDWEYNIDFDYNIGKRFYIHASYDSDYKYGAGLTMVW